MTEPAKPGILDRLRTRYKWFDHVMRAQERYQHSKGDFFAAGITYFTVFALFPLIMVLFSIAGFVLSHRPDLLDDIENRIRVHGVRRVRSAADRADERRRSTRARRSASSGWPSRHGPGWAGWLICARH